MITTQFLNSISNIVKITQIAKEANLNYQTISAKIRENRDLTTTESKLIEKVLKKYKLYSEEVESMEDNIDIEPYKHLTAGEIVRLKDKKLKEKLVEYQASMIPADYDVIEGGEEFLENY